jgi:hypothetical protein
MGRWSLRGIGALLILGAVVRGGGALNLWQVPNFRPTQSVSDCVAEGQRGYETGVARALGISREQIDPAAAATMTQAMRRLCRSAAARSTRPSLPELFRADPVAYQHLCRAGIEASFKTRPDAFWFTSRAERTHLVREHCQLLLRYMGDDQSTNWPRLIAENPSFFVLACGAALHAELARDDATRRDFTAGALHRIGRRSCSKGLRRGVIDTSRSRGLLDFSTDERAWDNLIVQVARNEGHA